MFFFTFENALRSNGLCINANHESVMLKLIALNLDTAYFNVWLPAFQQPSMIWLGVKQFLLASYSVGTFSQT